MFEERKNSILGIISIAIGILIGCGIFTLFVIAGYLEMSTPGGIREDSEIAIIIGLLVIGMLMIVFIGIILGVIGVFQQGKKKLFSILGTAINSLILLGTIAAIIVGNMMK